MSLTTNLARPSTSAIITVRVIKSFDFRTERSLVLRDINLETTTIGQLKTIVRDGMATSTLLRSLSTIRSLRYPPKNSYYDTDRMEALSLCDPWSVCAVKTPSATRKRSAH